MRFNQNVWRAASRILLAAAIALLAGCVAPARVTPPVIGCASEGPAHYSAWVPIRADAFTVAQGLIDHAWSEPQVTDLGRPGDSQNGWMVSASCARAVGDQTYVAAAAPGEMEDTHSWLWWWGPGLVLVLCVVVLGLIGYAWSRGQVELVHERAQQEAEKAHAAATREQTKTRTATAAIRTGKKGGKA